MYKRKVIHKRQPPYPCDEPATGEQELICSAQGARRAGSDASERSNPLSTSLEPANGFKASFDSNCLCQWLLCFLLFFKIILKYIYILTA